MSDSAGSVTMTGRICIFIAMFSALLFGFATTAVAQGESDDSNAEESTEESQAEFETLTRQGAKAFKEKDYEDARRNFERAYEIKPVPNLLYNIGRVSEKMGEFETAITYYERFVNEPDINLDARKDALDRIKTLREIVELRSEGEDVDKKEVADKQSDRGLEGADSEPARVERDYTMAWIFTGVGVAALAGGGFFALQTRAAHRDFEDAGTLGERRDAASRGQTSGIVADSLFGVGAVLTGIGVYFFISPPEREVRPEGATLNITPSIGRQAAGMQLKVDF